MSIGVQPDRLCLSMRFVFLMFVIPTFNNARFEFSRKYITAGMFGSKPEGAQVGQPCPFRRLEAVDDQR